KSLAPAELDRLLAVWRRLLTTAGVLIVGDVIPPDAGAVTDVLALLRYAARNGFFAAALGGLARTVFSPYRQLRSRIGVTRYTETQFADKLRAAGFTARRLPRNMEPNSPRMTFGAHPV